jgi:hypothetical protein|nr:hypothetical protein [Neorhizobium tomejilense]
MTENTVGRSEAPSRPYDPKMNVSRLTLMRDDAPDADLHRLNELEKASGYRTGTRFSFEGRRTFEVVCDLETGRYFVSEGEADAVPLTPELYKATSGLCYWVR